MRREGRVTPSLWSTRLFKALCSGPHSGVQGAAWAAALLLFVSLIIPSLLTSPYIIKASSRLILSLDLKGIYTDSLCLLQEESRQSSPPELPKGWVAMFL